MIDAPLSAEDRRNLLRCWQAAGRARRDELAPMVKNFGSLPPEERAAVRRFIEVQALCFWLGTVHDQELRGRGYPVRPAKGRRLPLDDSYTDDDDEC